MSKVEISNLSKYFGTTCVVDDLNFSVDKGEVLGFLGPNGAGKSTTMKMITGFLKPSAGRIRVGDFYIDENPIEIKRHLGYLPEGAPAYPEMTPLKFLDFIADMRGLSKQQKKQSIEETIDKVNLQSVLYQPIETLSKGFKRRVGLAQAIIHDPDVLILDEPTDGLDPNQKHEVRSLIRKMSENKVIILSTHILEEVEALCNRVIVIASGKLQTDDTPAQFEARSKRHNAVTISIEGVDIGTLGGSLQQLPEVASVETLEGQGSVTRVRVYPTDGANITTAISSLAVQKQWRLDELNVERGCLDEVFRNITCHNP